LKSVPILLLRKYNIYQKKIFVVVFLSINRIQKDVILTCKRLNTNRCFSVGMSSRGILVFKNIFNSKRLMVVEVR
jgi:hypothetical protein